MLRYIIPLLLLSSGCTTQEITFNSMEQGLEVNVVLAKLSDPNGVGETLGKAPVTVPLDKVKGKVVRLDSKGKQSQLWVIPDGFGEKTKAEFKLIDISAAQSNSAGGNTNSNVSITSLNQLARLMLKSYQALSGKRYEAALDLARQASSINPSLAAPFLIIGITQMQKGEKEAARLSLNKAKTLDPADMDIDRLLEAL